MRRRGAHRRDELLLWLDRLGVPVDADGQPVQTDLYDADHDRAFDLADLPPIITIAEPDRRPALSGPLHTSRSW